MVLLDTGTPGTSREIYSEDADGETHYVGDFMSHSVKVCDLSKQKGPEFIFNPCQV